jgi:nucleolar GTP-binding protein
MFLQKVGKIENARFHVDLAIRTANAQTVKLKKGFKGNWFERSREFQTRKIRSVEKALSARLAKIVKNFPNFDELPEFYAELSKITVDVVSAKKALRELDSYRRQLSRLAQHYADRIRKCNDMKYMEQASKAFYGRLHSSARKLDNAMQTLEKTRSIMRVYPVIKTGVPTVVLTGFPNVGKTTLLYKLTGSKPEIKEYAFTTKNINVSYLVHEGKKIQILDTPGSLDRPEKMNNIEKQAYLATKLLACCIVYIFDLTLPFALEKQVRLYEKLLESKKPLIAYVSKTDITTSQLETLEKYHPITELSQLKNELLRYG